MYKCGEKLNTRDLHYARPLAKRFMCCVEPIQCHCPKLKSSRHHARSTQVSPAQRPNAMVHPPGTVALQRRRPLALHIDGLSACPCHVPDLDPAPDHALGPAPDPSLGHAP
jgi:hypothetical protein